MKEKLEFIIRILRIFSNSGLHDYLYYDVENNDVEFYVNCNDLFWWGCSDTENVTPENIHVLEQAVKDIKLSDKDFGTIYACELFASRIRKMRPQGAAYPGKEHKHLWPLFDASGPERQLDPGNPFKPGEYKS